MISNDNNNIKDGKNCYRLRNNRSRGGGVYRALRHYCGVDARMKQGDINQIKVEKRRVIQDQQGNFQRWWDANYGRKSMTCDRCGHAGFRRH